MALPERCQRTNRRLNWVVVLTNVVGAGLVVFYFQYVYIHEEYTSITGPWMDWVVLIVGLAALIGGGGMLSDYFMRPMYAWYYRAAAGEVAAPAPEPIRRMALNSPIGSALFTFGAWILASFLISFYSTVTLRSEFFLWDVFWRIWLGTQIAGVVTSVLSYFAVERVWRGELPLFFADGNLTSTPAFRMTVRRRMLILFIISTIPLLEMALLTSLQAVQMVSAPDPQSLLPNLLSLQVFWVTVGLLLSVALANTLGASLVDPLEEFSRRMQRVAQGSLSEIVPVTSNDEIGALGERFNDMTGSLLARQNELDTVYQISQDISASLELEQILRTLVERLGRMIPFDAAQVCLYDSQAGVLVEQAEARAQQLRLEHAGRVYLLGQGSTGWIGQNRCCLLVTDAQQHAGPALPEMPGGGSPGGYLGLALHIGDALVGTLELFSLAPQAFSEHDRQLLETVAPQLAIAVQNALQVQARERQYQVQIEQLRIEIDEARRSSQVKAITETDYYQRLRQSARELRRTMKEETTNEDG